MPTSTTAPAPTASGVMTLATVAAELGCTPLHVSRLIARGHITAIMVGDSPRVMASEVARYVSAGAKDFNAPAFTGHASDLTGQDRGWFLNEEDHFVDPFVSAALKAAESLVLPQPEIESRYAALIAQHEKDLRAGNLVGRPNTLEVKLGVTGKLAAVVNSQPGGLLQPKPAVVTRYKRWAELYLTCRLRAITRRQLSKTPCPPLVALYESPESYRAIRGQALQQLMAGAITTTTLAKIPGPAGGYDVIVTYAVPHSALTADAEKLPALAF